MRLLDHELLTENPFHVGQQLALPLPASLLQGFLVRAHPHLEAGYAAAWYPTLHVRKR